jgi:phage/plasmid-associated DNA primase
LYGGNINKAILFQTGERGNNAKSKTIELDKSIFGDYFYTIPATFLTEKLKIGADPCLMGIEGTRFISIQEPDAKERMNIAKLKALSGNDEQKGRGMHENKTHGFIPQAKLIISCNKLPELDTDEEAFFNRVKVLDFEAQFSDDAPDDEKKQVEEKHFKINKTLEFTPDMIQGYMSLLIDTFLEYGIELEYPSQVDKATEMYKAKSNSVWSFVKDKLEVDETASKSFTELFSDYNEYYSDTYKMKSDLKKDEFVSRMKANTFIAPRINGNRVNGIRLLGQDEDKVETIIDKKCIDIHINDTLQNQYDKSDTFKRVKEIMDHFKIDINKRNSRQVKEFFIRNDVKVVDDTKNGHKIYIVFK